VYFGIALVTGGESNWSLISEGQGIQVLAQVLYAIGYSLPFTLEIGSAAVDCGVADFDEVCDR
jgi:hypothetical protein